MNCLGSLVHSLCWRKSKDPEPPSRHHCGLSAAKMEKHVPYRVCCCFQFLSRTFSCAVATLLLGGSGVFQRDLL